MWTFSLLFAIKILYIEFFISKVNIIEKVLKVILVHNITCVCLHYLNELVFICVYIVELIPHCKIFFLQRIYTYIFASQGFSIPMGAEWTKNPCLAKMIHVRIVVFNILDEFMYSLWKYFFRSQT